MSDAESASYLTDEYLNRLKQLSKAVETGDNEVADQLIGELTTLRESALFQELGKLTREIHESINAFHADEKIVRLAKEDIPDAKERLNYIITKTDEAAHRTMEGTEDVLRVVEAFNRQAAEIQHHHDQHDVEGRDDALALVRFDHEGLGLFVCFDVDPGVGDLVLSQKLLAAAAVGTPVFTVNPEFPLVH